MSLFAGLVFAACSQNYGSNGEAIYMSGATLDGEEIEKIVDLEALGNSSETLSCASCHGNNARGAKNPIPAFGPFVAPPIAWSDLTSPENTVPYTEISFAYALREGIAPEGYRLHHPMPRWLLSDTEMNDLVTFLKTK